MSEQDTPTIVLVHGGFADASFWSPVIKDLQAHDLPVLAPPNHRGLAHDAEYIAATSIRSMARCSSSATPTGRSRSPAPARPTRSAWSTSRRSSSTRACRSARFSQFGETPLVGAVRPNNYPLDNGETAVELTIAPELYKEAFAADLSDDLIEVLAVSQRRSPRSSRIAPRPRPGVAALVGGGGHRRQRHTPRWRAAHSGARARRRSRSTHRIRSRSRSRPRLRT